MRFVKNTERLPLQLDDFFNTDWFGGATATKRVGVDIPAVNIKETDASFDLELAIPGFSKENFNLELDKDVLTISAVVSDEENVSEATEKGTYSRREFRYGAFKRSFTLPDSIDRVAIEASYENGILGVSLPKKEEAKEAPKRLISIS